MATKVIDHIQSEQIVKLEEDVNILKNALNLMIGDINILAPKLTPIVSNLNSLRTSISNNYVTPGARSPLEPSSTDGLLKRLTEFDDLYTEHISRKFPPVVDIRGCPHVGYHVDNTTSSASMIHAHPEGWTGNTGTCLTATASINPDYTYNWTPGGWSNVSFVPLSSDRPDVPTNQTWAGIILWYAMPTAILQITGTTLFTICNIWHESTTITMPDTAGLAVGQLVYGLEDDPLPYIASISSGISIELNRDNAAGSGAYHSDNLHFHPIITNVDFRLEIFANNATGHKNCSYGYGKSVGDEMMSGYGAMQSGVWQSGFFATVTSVGSQLEVKPDDDTPTYRSPHVYLSAYDPLGYGDDSPGVGGPEEEADWGEGGSHNIMDESNQLDDEEYITHVLNTTVVPSYLSQEQILFMSDEDKAKRARRLVRMTRNRLHDDSIWETENVSDGVLTADDFIT